MALLCCESLDLPGAQFSRGAISDLGIARSPSVAHRNLPCRRFDSEGRGALMWRGPDYKEAVAWLKANAQGPTGFYLWGSI